MNHKSIRGTKHYTHPLQENIKSRFAEAPKEGLFESKLKHMEKYLIKIIDELENQLNYKGKNDNAQYKVINS